MEYAEYPAPAPLADVVRCFWFLRGRLPASAVQPVVSDGRIEIVLHLAEPFARVAGDAVTRQEDALVAGQLTRPIHLAGGGEAEVIGIRFRTAAAARILGGDLDVLTDEVVPLAALDARLRRALLDAARPSGNDATRVRALTAVLLRALRGVGDPVVDGFVAWCEDARQAPLPHAAHRAGVSVRTLERRVLRVTGVQPAVLRRITRFRRAFRLLGEGTRGRWAEVAAACGYYDQAHLIRDFRAFTGESPSAFLDGEVGLARALAGEA